MLHRLLLVCESCWRREFPDREPPKPLAKYSTEECFVCEQARGVIYVRATVIWTADA